MCMNYTVDFADGSCNDEKVNVLMCVYKEKISIVKTAVLSVLNQSYPNVELIVVIDNPERKDVIRLLDVLKVEKSIQYTVNKRNIGLAKSLNVGLKMCTAPYIARMDADDISEFSRVEHQLNYLKKNKCDIVGGYMELINENGKFIKKKTDIPVKDKYIRRLLCYKSAVPHPTWFVKKEVYDSLKGYRDIYSAEDYDFLVRAALEERKFGILPEICIKYRMSESGITQNNLALQKILSECMQRQYKSRKTWSLDKSKEYVQKNQKRLNYNKRFYELIKSPHKTAFNWGELLCSGQMFAEVRERLGSKIILWKDRHDYC